MNKLPTLQINTPNRVARTLLFGFCTILALASVRCSSSGDIIDLSRGSTTAPSLTSTDTTPPTIKGPISCPSRHLYLDESPSLTWSAATDVGGSGVAYYQISIGSSTGATDVLSWTPIGNVTTYQVTGLALIDGTTYFPSLRAVDIAGNISSTIQGDGWLAKTPTWAQQSFIKAANSDSGDAFGIRIALHKDTMVVATPVEDSNQTTITNGTTASTDNSALNSGAAYVYTRSGVNWVQEAYLKAPNAKANDRFGASVAVSGDTIVVGSYSEKSLQTAIINGTTASNDISGSNVGAAFVFRRSGTTWSSEAYLKAPNAESSDQFGDKVAIDGDTIVVGATGEDSNQTSVTNGPTASSDNSASGAGAAYVFKRTGSIWVQEAYLKAPNADISDQFGSSVAISGDTIAVGAAREDSNQTTVTNGTTASSDNSASDSGAVYVFKRTGSNWAQEAYLKAPNSTMGAGCCFGDALAIDGDTIVVGRYNEPSNQTTISNGATASFDTSAPGAGAAYVFKRTGTTWVQEAYLKSPNADIGDNFGNSVAISGDTIAVTAWDEDSNQTIITNGSGASSDNSASTTGAVYIFKRRGSTWSNEAYIKAPNAEALDQLGNSGVGLSGDTVVVGACGEASALNTITNGPTASSDNTRGGSGAAYVFKR